MSGTASDNFRYLVSGQMALIMVLSIFAGAPLPGGLEVMQGADGATIVVDKGGGGDYTTIQAAIDAANPGDAITVNAGTYVENVLVGTDQLTITGAGKATTIINGSKSGDVVNITADDVTISGFTVEGSGNETFPQLDSGVRIYNADNCVLDDLRVRGNLVGVFFNVSTGSTLKDSQVKDNTVGAYLREAASCTVKDSTFEGHPAGGILVLFADENDILRNTCTYNDEGITLYEANLNTITDCVCRFNYDSGIDLSFSDNNDIFGCNLSQNDDTGVDVWKSSDTVIDNNTLMNNSWGGLWVRDCLRTTFKNNLLPGNGYNGIDVSESNYTEILNNNVYESSYTGLELDNSWFCRVRNNTVNNNRGGMEVRFCNKSSIDGNTCLYNDEDGIQVRGSTSNMFANNTCSNNDDHGLSLYVNSVDNVVKSNICNNNKYSGIALSYSSDGNTINKNLVKNNEGDGILLLERSSDNRIFSNVISYNDDGIYLVGKSNDNIIFHNDIIYNGIGAFDHSLNSGNQFSKDGEGNFWSNYYGKDDGSDDRTAGDGIGDTLLDHEDLDSYPLMTPWMVDYLDKPVISGPKRDDDGEFNLTWNFITGATGYILQEDDSDAFSTPTTIYEGTDMSFNVTNRTQDTYYYVVTANGSASAAIPSSMHTVVVDFPPLPPDNLWINGWAAGNRLDLNWDYDGGTAPEIFSSYEVFYKTNETRGAWSSLVNISYPNWTYSHKGLTNGVKYSYKVRSWDPEGVVSEFSDIASRVPMDTAAPSPPSGVYITNITTSSMTVVWNQSQSSDVEGYHLYWNENETGVYSLVREELISTLMHTVTDLDPGTTYYFMVTSIDEVPNESQLINPVNATTLGSPDDPGGDVEKPGISYLDITMTEDTVDSDSIDFQTCFGDIPITNFLFRCYDQDNVEARINKMNGVVTLVPDKDWSGVDVLYFHASNSDVNHSCTVNITVTGVNDFPGLVNITSPAYLSYHLDGASVTLSAECDDPDIPYGDSLTFTWASDVDGPLGKGASIHVSNLSVGEHKLTVTVTDTQGGTSLGSTEIYINETGDSDSDGDGMPNVWELKYGLDPLNASDAAADDDGDGISNLEEYQSGSDPTLPESTGEEKSGTTEPDGDTAFWLIIIVVIITLVILMALSVLYINMKAKAARTRAWRGADQEPPSQEAYGEGEARQGAAPGQEPYPAEGDHVGGEVGYEDQTGYDAGGEAAAYPDERAAGAQAGYEETRAYQEAAPEMEPVDLEYQPPPGAAAGAAGGAGYAGGAAYADEEEAEVEEVEAEVEEVEADGYDPLDDEDEDEWGGLDGKEDDDEWVGLEEDDGGDAGGKKTRKASPRDDDVEVDLPDDDDDFD